MMLKVPSSNPRPPAQRATRIQWQIDIANELQSRSSRVSPVGILADARRLIA
jgi:hypothetical protein